MGRHKGHYIQIYIFCLSKMLLSMLLLLEMFSGDVMVACFLHKAVLIQTNFSSALELARKRLCVLSPPSHSKLSVRKDAFALLSVGKHCFLACRAVQGNGNLGRCPNSTI